MGVKLGKANATQSTSRGFFLKTSTTCFDPNWVVTHTTTQPHNYPTTPNKKLQEFNTCGLFNVKLSIDWLYLDFTIEAVKNSSCKYRWFDWLVWKSLRLGFLRGFVCSRRYVARPRLRCNAFQKSTQWKNTQKAVFKESFSCMKKRYISTSTWESWVSYIEISFYISFFFWGETTSWENWHMSNLQVPPNLSNNRGSPATHIESDPTAMAVKISMFFLNKSGWKWMDSSWSYGKNWLELYWVFQKIGVPKNGWFITVYNGKPYWNGWFGGTTILGNP